jgi:SAM-dependent methyltransferase
MAAGVANPRQVVIALAGQGGYCAEIGCWKGDFSARVLQAARPRALHLIDPWLFQPSFPARWYGGALAGSQADMDAIHAGVQRRFAASPHVQIHRTTSLLGARQFDDGVFDWVYIDGDHSRRAVLDDLTAWHSKVRPGGYLVCDDYLWVDESGKLSVKAAIHDFLAAHPHHRGGQIHTQFAILISAG